MHNIVTGVVILLVAIGAIYIPAMIYSKKYLAVKVSKIKPSIIRIGNIALLSIFIKQYILFDVESYIKFNSIVIEFILMMIIMLIASIPILHYGNKVDKKFGLPGETIKFCGFMITHADKF
ncbi:MAG: hypothetical protein WCH46_09140 [bacterium]